MQYWCGLERRAGPSAKLRLRGGVSGFRAVHFLSFPDRGLSEANRERLGPKGVGSKKLNKKECRVRSQKELRSEYNLSHLDCRLQARRRLALLDGSLGDDIAPRGFSQAQVTAQY